MRNLLFCILCLISAAAGSKEPSTTPATPSPSAADALAAARSEALAILKLEEGVWDAAIEFPPENPGDAPKTARGVQTNTFVTGNGWIKNDFTVDEKYGGHGTWGYDPKKGRYVGIWVDSNQDYIRLDEGTFDSKTQTMTWTSELRQPDPYPPAKYRMTEEFKGEKRVLTMTAIGAKSGREIPLGTIVFTRRH
ncbi:MAG TPA: DUF1579 family protein [Rhodanobacteraceae bacterium]|jgi:hypothetical protein|nr:DUF1579 family protein [Rhodanobacteraceae bacterium]